MTAVQVRGLRKSYGAQEAVRGVSLSIAEGEVYALLGHNGAGKSTIVEILEGHRTRDAGEVSVLGVDPANGGRAFRDRIGIVLQTSGVESELTVREAIDLYGSGYRRRRHADEVIALVGLEDKAMARIDTLSGGQRRRLDLANPHRMSRLASRFAPAECLALDDGAWWIDRDGRREVGPGVSRLAADGAVERLAAA